MKCPYLFYLSLMNPLEIRFSAIIVLPNGDCANPQTVFSPLQPPILIWTKHFGYFRDQAGSPLTFIILMDSKNSAPTLTKFICSTHDEVARWQKIFSEGFDSFGKAEEPEMESLCKLSEADRILSKCGQIWIEKKRPSDILGASDTFKLISDSQLTTVLSHLSANHTIGFSFSLFSYLWCSAPYSKVNGIINFSKRIGD